MTDTKAIVDCLNSLSVEDAISDIKLIKHEGADNLRRCFSTCDDICDAIEALDFKVFRELSKLLKVICNAKFLRFEYNAGYLWKIDIKDKDSFFRFVDLVKTLSDDDQKLCFEMLIQSEWFKCIDHQDDLRRLIDLYYPEGSLFLTDIFNKLNDEQWLSIFPDPESVYEFFSSRSSHIDLLFDTVFSLKDTVSASFIKTGEDLARLLLLCGNNQERMYELLDSTPFLRKSTLSFSEFLGMYAGDADRLSSVIFYIRTPFQSAGNLFHILQRVNQPEYRHQWITRQTGFDGFHPEEAAKLIDDLPLDMLESYLKKSELLSADILSHLNRDNQDRQNIIDLYITYPELLDAQALETIHAFNKDDFLKYMKHHFIEKGRKVPSKDILEKLVKPFIHEKDVVLFLLAHRRFSSLWDTYQIELIWGLAELGEQGATKLLTFDRGAAKQILDRLQALQSTLEPLISNKEICEKWVGRLFWAMGIWNVTHFNGLFDGRREERKTRSYARPGDSDYYYVEYVPVKAGIFGQSMSVLIAAPFVLPVAVVITVLNIIPMIIGGLISCYKWKLSVDIDAAISDFPEGDEDLPKKIVGAYKEQERFHQALFKVAQEETHHDDALTGAGPSSN